MSIRLYRVTGKYEAYVLAYGAADAAKYGGRGRTPCERVYDVTAKAATEADSLLATRLPDPSYVYREEFLERSEWTVAQWIEAAPGDAAAEADRLRAEAATCDLRAARLRAEAEELAKIAAMARGAETTEPKSAPPAHPCGYLGTTAGTPEDWSHVLSEEEQ